MNWLVSLVPTSILPENRREFFSVAIGETFKMVSITLVVAGLAGLIIGSVLYATRPGNLLQNRWIFGLVNVIVNIVRPIPFIIFLAAVGPITLRVIGTMIGNDAFTFAMILVATFYIARVVEQNLVSVDPGIVEAARSMGASRARTLITVVIPEALAPLILGYTFAVIAIVDMSALAGIIGGGGLGNFALQYGYQAFKWEITIFTLVVIIVIVQIIQLIGNSLARRVLRNG